MRASIKKLSEHIKSQPNLEPGEKEELLELLAGIETETAAKAEGGADPGADECECADDSVTSVVRMTAKGVEEQSLPEQLDGSLLKLEATYPNTAAALGRIAHVLSRMGI